MFEREIKELYEKIPASVCSPDCCKCCKDMIQFSPSEERNMGGYEWNGKCRHLKNGRCSIYEKRPFVCRLYGTSVLLKCDKCTPERFLSEEDTLALVREYNKFRNMEIGELKRTIKS